MVSFPIIYANSIFHLNLVLFLFESIPDRSRCPPMRLCRYFIFSSAPQYSASPNNVRKYCSGEERKKQKKNQAALERKFITKNNGQRRIGHSYELCDTTYTDEFATRPSGLVLSQIFDVTRGKYRKIQPTEELTNLSTVYTLHRPYSKDQ